MPELQESKMGRPREAVDVLRLPRVKFCDRRQLPKKSGIYFVLNVKLEVIYIGRSNQIKTRWAACHHKEHRFRHVARFIAWYLTEHPEWLEMRLIADLKPRFNGLLPPYYPRCKSPRWQRPKGKSK